MTTNVDARRQRAAELQAEADAEARGADELERRSTAGRLERERRWLLAMLGGAGDRERQAKAPIVTARRTLSQEVVAGRWESIRSAFLAWQRAIIRARIEVARTRRIRGRLAERHGYVMRTDFGSALPFDGDRQATLVSGSSTSHTPATDGTGGMSTESRRSIVDSILAGVLDEDEETARQEMRAELETLSDRAVDPPTDLVEQGLALAFDVDQAMEAALSMRDRPSRRPPTRDFPRLEAETEFDNLAPEQRRRALRYLEAKQAAAAARGAE